MQDPEQIKKEIHSASSLKDLDALHKKYLGRKGSVSLALRGVADLAGEEKKEQAKKLQSAKREIQEAITAKSRELASQEAGADIGAEWLDVSAPGAKVEAGHLHPLTHIQNQVGEIFTSLGFEVAEGPEVETEWYNFDALNIPQDHPARDLWDTFWLKPTNNKQPITNNGHKSSVASHKLLLRTHTSPVQIRYMQTHQPPLRIIVPGRAFRHEASDASHDIQFYQLEGLMIDKDISVANFKAVIGEFLSRLFGEDVKVRLRPSFFPFVEPGFEVDMSCVNCDGKGCSVCSRGGWLEMLGAGMVHPNVLKAAGYNPKNPAKGPEGLRGAFSGWQGFAFGVGLDRIAMMKYKIDDIRLMYSGDLRFLKQF